jgi:hypothetical protein
MKVLQTLACKARQKMVSRDLGLILYPQCSPTRAHLDELLLGVEMGYNDILPIGNTSQGDAQTPTGMLVAISR